MLREASDEDLGTLDDGNRMVPRDSAVDAFTKTYRSYTERNITNVKKTIKGTTSSLKAFLQILSIVAFLFLLSLGISLLIDSAFRRSGKYDALREEERQNNLRGSFFELNEGI